MKKEHEMEAENNGSLLGWLIFSPESPIDQAQNLRDL
jgi:hypothetical protein